jgi:hypothetical protein
MPGTKTGGEISAQKNKERYGEDFYARIGAIGGSRSFGTGFTSDTARIWGAVGGSLSRKGRKLTPDERAKVKARIFKTHAEALANLTRIQQAARERRAKG